MKIWLHGVENQSANETLQLTLFNQKDTMSYDLVLAPGEKVAYHDLSPQSSVQIPEANASTFADAHLRLRIGQRLLSLYANNGVVRQVEGETFDASAPPLAGYSGVGALELVIDENSQPRGRAFSFATGPQLASVSWAVSRYALYGLRQGIVTEKPWLTTDWGYSAWLDQPKGGLKGPLAAVTTLAPNYAVFGLGNDGNLWQKSWVGLFWDDWSGHLPPRGGVKLLGISAVTWLKGHYGVYAVASDGHLYQKYVNGVLGWMNWNDLGQPDGVKLSGPVASVSWLSGHCAAYALGADGQVWEKWFGAVWSRWHSMGTPPSPLLSLTSVSPVPLSYSVAGVAADGHLYVREYQGAWQGGWVDYGHPAQTTLAGPVTALGQASGVAMYYALGVDGAMYQYFDRQWTPLDGR